jgi:hypothetical protein
MTASDRDGDDYFEGDNLDLTMVIRTNSDKDTSITLITSRIQIYAAVPISLCPHLFYMIIITYHSRPSIATVLHVSLSIV